MRSKADGFGDEDDSQEVEGHSGRAKTGRQTKARPQPLFIPDSDEEVAQAVRSVDESDDEMSARTKTRAADGVKRKAYVMAASSSEDEGYKKRRKRRK